jgi:rod shape-determining protein MreD
MTLTFWQRLDRAGRNLAPFAVTVLLVLVGMMPVRIPYFVAVTPLLVLTSVYYWTIHRPDLLRPAVMFGIGLLQDILTGAPLGLNALVLLAAHGIVVTQRRFFLASTFALMWFGFTLVAVGAGFLEWAIVSVFNATLMRVDAVVAQTVLTLALFPLMAAVFIRIHRAFLQG